MKAGMGDGGACHPRDNIALRWLAKELSLILPFQALVEFNNNQYNVPGHALPRSDLLRWRRLQTLDPPRSGLVGAASLGLDLRARVLLLLRESVRALAVDSDQDPGSASLPPTGDEAGNSCLRQAARGENAPSPELWTQISTRIDDNRTLIWRIHYAARWHCV